MDPQERYEGAIMGHVIADALGTAHTMKEPRDIPIELEMAESTDAVTGLRVAKGQLSDDGSQLICLGESLITRGFDAADQFLRYQRWLRHGYATPFGKAIGYGNRTVRLLKSEARLDRQRMRIDDQAVRGTGGLMRVLAIPLYYRGSVRNIVEKAKSSTAVTHNSEEAMLYSAMYAVLVDYVLKGLSKEEALDKLRIKFASDKRASKLLAKDFSSLTFTDETPDYFSALATLEVVLWAWYSTNDYEQAITRAIRVGQNTDTCGAVTGGLVGAAYGVNAIQKQWLDEVLMKARLMRLAQRLYRHSLRALVK